MAVTPAPQISVDVKAWVKAHPDTNVRVCVGGNCAAGNSNVVVTGQDPMTPFHHGDTVDVTVDPIRDSTPVGSIQAIARLSDGQCGQWGAHLQLTAGGRVRPLAG